MTLEEHLRAALEGEVRFDRVSRALYSTDASVYQMMPLGVVLPRSREDVVRTVRLCREHGVSLTARGGGTSQAGQAIGTGVQLDFGRYMDRVVEVDPGGQWVRVEPGIVLDELNARLKPHGLHLPLDISTSDRATLGGMIANNSAGTRSVVYGKTLDYVLELTAVLSDGSVVELRPLEPAELESKCAQPDLEGDCHRTVRRLAQEHAEEIQRRYPRILRRVGGYNLDEFGVRRSAFGVRDGASEEGCSFPEGRTPKAERRFNLSRLIAGSEGTLGLVVEAKVRLAPLPKARAVAVAQFHDLLESLAATPVILGHGPSAVELLDRFILDSTRGKLEYEPLRDFIAGDPAAVLVVEFFADDPGELPARLDALEADLRARGLGYHFHRAVEPAAQARIWKLRRAALGLSMSERGDAKAISFVEDTAVSPDRLRDYIERFQEILAAHDTHAGFYAHASVGLLHVRPVVNLKTEAGVETFRHIAEEIAKLVLEFGGALSGEHGDGLVRAPFQEKMFGPVLYRAFREVKQAFDPTGLFNPGKIVDAPPLTENLRFGPRYEAAELLTTFDFSDFGGLARAAEQCGGVGECRKRLSGTMCPSYMATREESASTRGRANVLRLALSGQLGPQGLTDPELFPVLDLCLECKACRSECPTGVDMARLKAEFLHQYHRAHGTPLRARVIARTEQIARWGSRLAPLANPLQASLPIRRLFEKTLGLDSRRTLPSFAPRTFLGWWRRCKGMKERESGGGGERENGRAGETSSTLPLSHSPALFPDTFTNYYEPEIGIAAIRLLEAAGQPARVAPRVCCGRPLISKGALDGARRQAEASVRALSLLVGEGIPILFCEPGCYSAVRDDHPKLLRGELQKQALRVAEACLTFEEWAAATFAGAGLVRAGPTQLLLHSHCHQRALVGSEPGARALGTIPGCRVTDLDSGCCGMAGTFGYEREHYELSRQVGELRLFPAVRERAPEAGVVAAGFSCRHQIRHFTAVEAVHPAVLLADLLEAS